MRYDDCEYIAYYCDGQFLNAYRIQTIGFRMNKLQFSGDFYNSRIPIKSEMTIKKAEKQGYAIRKINIERCHACGTPKHFGGGKCFCDHIIAHTKQKLQNILALPINEGGKIKMHSDEIIEMDMIPWRKLGLKAEVEDEFRAMRRKWMERHPDRVITD